MHACMYICMCMHACMHICMYACMNICMYICMHACMHVFMYACIYDQTVHGAGSGMGWRGRGCGKRHGDAGKLSRVCSCRSPTTYWLRPHKKKTKPPDTRIRGGTRAICVCWERACAHAHGPMAGIRTASRLHTGTAASQAEKTRDRAGAAARGERASKKHGGRSPTGSGAQRWGIAQGAPDCGAVPQTTRPRRRLRTHRSASTRTVAAETRARASAGERSGQETVRATRRKGSPPGVAAPG